jgi:hypothetical protein
MNLYIFQKDEITPNIWKDAFDSANVGPVDANLGSWVIIGEYKKQYKFYDRHDSKLVMFGDPNDPKNIIIRHPNDFTNSAIISFRIGDIKTSMSKMAKANDKMIVYAGEIFGSDSNHEQVSKTVSFFGRPDNEDIVNLVTGNPISENSKLVPFFFVFKGNKELYYIVPNLSHIQVSNTVANGSDSQDLIVAADTHLGSFNNFIFRPTVGRNARIINDTNIMVKGNTLTVKPFDTFLGNGLKQFFKFKDVKCSSSYKYTRDQNGLYFDIDSPNGYIILRYNTVTAMDSRLRLSNRFRKEYTITKIGN